jgi:hypothetical protein
MNRSDPWRTALALLLVVGAVLFAIGTTLERNEKDSHQEPAATAASEENSEAESEEGEEHAASEGSTAEESSEEILGIDIESPFFVALGVATSLALAAGVWLLRRREFLLVVGLFAVAFTVLDVRELLHQLDETNEGIALLVIVIALLHAAAVAAAAVLYRRDAQPAR